jgi:hypothetical protein
LPVSRHTHMRRRAQHRQGLTMVRRTSRRYQCRTQHRQQPNPDPLIYTSRPSSTAFTQSLWGDRFNAMRDDVWSYKGDDESPSCIGHTAASTPQCRQGMTRTMNLRRPHTPQLDHPRPSTDSDSSTNPDLDWNHHRRAQDRRQSPKMRWFSCNDSAKQCTPLHQRKRLAEGGWLSALTKNHLKNRNANTN